MRTWRGKAARRPGFSSAAVPRALEVAAGFVDRARAEILSVSDNRAGRALADTAQHLLDSVAAAATA